MNIVVTILLIAALLLANAFFVASEFCLISSRRDRIENLIAQGKPTAEKVLHATEHLSIMLAGSQFGITICSLVLGKVAEPAVAHFIEEPFLALGVPEAALHPVAFALALAVITFLHILFGEMVPKNIAIAGPETLAMWLAPAIIGWVKITRPLIEFLNWLARITLRALGIEQKDELDSTVGQDELASMIAESRAEGFLDAEEHARLNKALRSDDRSLAEVTVPLEKVRALDFGTAGPTLGALEELLAQTGFSRFPVADRDGSFLGYVHVKDVLDRLSVAEVTEAIPRTRLRPLITLDAAQPLDEALNTLHVRNAHMAQVRERGRLVGIVFLEDLIEEYVGTVTDWTHEGDEAR
ncbi:membrane protein [Corynebacterium atypicum]|uniref:Membrane protein n=1 Tax=Corynebacterium atypicum TaxID=191610 RepID=A0ABM5QN15_9CORY|nr:hemolysin family protein [Corynebacterium atypicum]AIG64162.1 membrane protein [Corynebacterium atypicum]